MKKIIVGLLLGFMVVTYGYAETASQGDDTASLEQLRKKIVTLKKEMDYLIKDLRESDTLGVDMAPFASDVKVDITQDEQNILVKADIPGM
ncbi:MAG: hypothetical protein PHS37_00600, partial [Candidatus Omnitrophica bacterium]|nr:hypothetical protein [Candidatus Omnitrophota bacterium]